MDAKKESVVTISDSLAGHYFHSVSENGKISWQGIVVGRPEDGWYLVQLFNWIDGEPSIQMLVKFEDMASWMFYDTSEDMQFSYDHGTASGMVDKIE